MSTDKRRGFTLIELLIVVVIIGILASIAIPKFSATREKAFLSTLKTDLKNLASKQEIYHNTAFAYGNTLATVGATVSDGVTITPQRGDWLGLGRDCVPRGPHRRTLWPVSRPAAGGDFNTPHPAIGGLTEDACTVVKLVGITDVGGVVVVDVRKSDVLSLHPTRN